MSEERFKSMTPLQWLFHYFEITKFKKLEAEDETSKTNLHIEMLKSLLNRLAFVVYALDSELGKKLLEPQNQSTMNKDKEVTAENFQEAWGELLKDLPDFVARPEVLKKRSKLPTFSRDQLRQRAAGINIETK